MWQARQQTIAGYCKPPPGIGLTAANSTIREAHSLTEGWKRWLGYFMLLFFLIDPSQLNFLPQRTSTSSDIQVLLDRWFVAVVTSCAIRKMQSRLDLRAAKRLEVGYGSNPWNSRTVPQNSCFLWMLISQSIATLSGWWWLEPWNLIRLSIQLGMSSSQLLLTPSFFRGVGEPPMSYGTCLVGFDPAVAQFHIGCFFWCPLVSHLWQVLSPGDLVLIQAHLQPRPWSFHHRLSAQSDMITIIIVYNEYIIWLVVSNIVYFPQ